MYRRCILFVKWCLASRCTWSLTHNTKCWRNWTRGHGFAWPRAFNNFVVTHWMHRLLSKLVRCWFIDGSSKSVRIIVISITLLLEIKFLEVVVLMLQVLVVFSSITFLFSVIWVFWERFYSFIDYCWISIRKFWCIYFNIVRRRTWDGSIFLLIWTILFIKWESSLSSMKKNLIIIMTISVDYLTTILAFSIWDLHRILSWI